MKGPLKVLRMKETKGTGYCITRRKVLDRIQFLKDGKEIMELVIVSIKKDSVKLALRSDRSITFVLTYLEEGSEH